MTRTKVLEQIYTTLYSRYPYTILPVVISHYNEWIEMVIERFGTPILEDNEYIAFMKKHT